MLTHYLDQAIAALEQLLWMTEEDIAAIKRADNGAVFERITSKEHAIVTFEKIKHMVDNEIAKLARENPGISLESLLDDGVKERLQTMREHLKTLQSANRRFAKFVVHVGEFYNALYEQMLPVETDGYRKGGARSASLLEIRV